MHVNGENKVLRNIKCILLDVKTKLGNPGNLQSQYFPLIVTLYVIIIVSLCILSYMHISAGFKIKCNYGESSSQKLSPL